MTPIWPPGSPAGLGRRPCSWRTGFLEIHRCQPNHCFLRRQLCWSTCGTTQVRRDNSREIRNPSCSSLLVTAFRIPCLADLSWNCNVGLQKLVTSDDVSSIFSIHSGRGTHRYEDSNSGVRQQFRYLCSSADILHSISLCEPRSEFDQWRRLSPSKLTTTRFGTVSSRETWSAIVDLPHLERPVNHNTAPVHPVRFSRMLVFRENSWK